MGLFRRKNFKIGDEIITHEEIEKLATYNSEVARGLVHRPTYVIEMRELQNKFNIK